VRFGRAGKKVREAPLRRANAEIIGLLTELGNRKILLAWSSGCQCQRLGWVPEPRENHEFPVSRHPIFAIEPVFGSADLGSRALGERTPTLRK
jgi:hypothetical protein